MTEPGDLISFGGDPTGGRDSSQALRDAVASEHPVHIGPGFWRLDSPVRITTPKLIYCGGSMLPDYTHPEWFPAGAQQSTVFTTENLPSMIEIASGGVHIYGGCWDTRQVGGHQGSVFRYDLSTGARIWGGSITGFSVLGNRESLYSPGKGTTAIHVDLENGIAGGFICLCEWEGRAQDVARFFRDSKLPVATGMFASACRLRAEVDGFKYGVLISEIDQMSAECFFEARYCLSESERAAEPGYGICTAADLCNVAVHGADFGSTPDASGRYRPEVVWHNPGHLNKQHQWRGYLNGVPTGIRPIGGTIEGSFGLLPHMKQGLWTGGAVIADLHGESFNVDKRNDVQIGCFKGREDLQSFVDPSAGTVPISSGLTITYPEDLFRVAGLHTSLKANTDAVAGGDYLEITIRGYEKLKYLWAALSNSLIGVRAVQLITYDTSGTLRDNIWLPCDEKVPSFRRQQEVLSCETSGIASGLIIIRVIGLLTPNRAMTIHDLNWRQIIRQEHHAFLPSHGGTIYGDLEIKGKLTVNGKLIGG